MPDHNASTPAAAAFPSPAQTLPHPRIPALEFWVMAALTIVGTVLRFYHLGAKSLWFDEAVIYHIAQDGWREILALNATDNSAPPLFALLLGVLTGPDASEAILRTPGAVAGVVAIPLTYLLAREFTASRIALLAPLLVAFAPTQIVYAQQLREYSLTVCLASLMLIAYSRFIRNPDTRHALWIAATAGLGLATQYGLGLFLVSLNLVCLVALWRHADRRPAYFRWFVAQLVPAAVTMIVVVNSNQLGLVGVGKAGYLGAHYWNGTAPGLWSLLTSPENDLVNYAFPGYLMLGLTVAGALAFLFRAASPLASALLVVPALINFLCAVAGLYPYGAIRQVIFLTPMIYVSAALGLEALTAGAARLLPAVIPLGMAVAVSAAIALPGLQESIGFLRRSGGKEPMRPLVETLERRVQPGETIYVYWGAQPAFRYYWRHRPEPWIQGARHWSGLDAALAARQMPDVQNELLLLIARGRPFWVVVTHIEGPDATFLFEFLQRSAVVSAESGIPGTRLLRVTPRPR